MKKIVVQQLADSLELSRVTVWKVLNQRPGVAPETTQRVLAAIEKLQQESDSDGGEKQIAVADVKNITLIASRANSSLFWMSIVDQIANVMNTKGIQLNYIPMNITEMSVANLRAMLQPDKTNGLISINVYDKRTISAVSEANVPKVFFDTLPGLTPDDLRGDLILLEGEQIMEEVTRSVIDRGCRRIGFIGDIHYAQTNLLRWNGFINAMERGNVPVNHKYCFIGPILNYPEQISAFLDGLPDLPEAFVCVSDFVAFRVFNLLNDRRCRIPDDLILTGYDDAREFLLDHHGVTSVHVRNGLLGKRMASQLFYRIENPTADYEEIQVRPKIVFRS